MAGRAGRGAVPPDGEAEPGAQLVRVDLAGRHATVTRHAGERLRVDRALPAGAHLSVDLAEPHRPFLELAEIVVAPDGRDAAAVLATLPGCLLATGPLGDGSWLVAGPDGLAVRVAGAGRVGASVVHAWLAAGRDPAELPGPFEVTTGGRTRTVTVRASPPPAAHRP
ncbi:hypothetical protein BJF78_30685 [Pseudonocardia sp. CNS-139]|nr:hypothetical protein BJF78_30685 [Pseudonocardia sp. CNS-139]